MGCQWGRARHDCPNPGILCSKRAFSGTKCVQLVCVDLTTDGWISALNSPSNSPKLQACNPAHERLRQVRTRRVKTYYKVQGQYGQLALGPLRVLWQGSIATPGPREIIVLYTHPFLVGSPAVQTLLHLLTECGSLEQAQGSFLT